MSLKAVVFDLDDCLVQTFDPAVRSLADTVKMWNLERKPVLHIPEREVFARHYRGTWSDWVTGIWPELSESIERFKYFFIANEPGHRYSAMPGAKRAIEFVSSKGMFLGILTGREDHLIKQTIVRTGLPYLRFDFIRSLHQTGRRKSDPAAYQDLIGELHRRGIMPDQALYVGDQLDDMGCLNAGMRFAAVCSGVTARKAFLKAGMLAGDVLGSVKDLPAYLQTKYL
jgi:phosphoglycolate phosphatase-like HAD superfamily hydrolase